MERELRKRDGSDDAVIREATAEAALAAAQAGKGSGRSLALVMVDHRMAPMTGRGDGAVAVQRVHLHRDEPRRGRAPAG